MLFTELFICTNKNNTYTPITNSINILGHFTPFKDTAKCLGVTLDKYLTYDTYISEIRKKSFLLLRNCFRIRKFLDTKHAKLVINAYVSCQFDYCNSLFSASTKQQIYKLQQIQNTCARFIYKQSRMEHNFTLVFKQLHWLPVDKRIEFKLCLMVHECLYGSAPHYLSTLIHITPSSQSLRSQYAPFLYQPLSNYSKCGAFSIIGPKLWNRLPHYIRMIRNRDLFKSTLKTFLFNKLY